MLPRYANSAIVNRGGCGALLYDDTECELRAGHLRESLQRPHRSHGPNSISRYVEYDDEGNVIRWVPEKAEGD